MIESDDHEVARIDGSGTDEAVWSAWPALQSLPRLSDWPAADRARRLVVVAPHPDDEILACGGLLSQRLEAGGAVLVIGVTDGEASHAGSADWKPAALARRRRDERREGLSRLGGGHASPTAVTLGLPDGQVAAHRRRLEYQLERNLEPHDVVVTTWAHDGHPDHEAVGGTCRSLARTIGFRLFEAPVWMWHWAEPCDARVPWRRLRRVDLPGAAVRRKLDALRAHVSQLDPRGRPGGAVLVPSIVARAYRPFEYLFL